MYSIQSSFVSSSDSYTSCPNNTLPEFAFIGRSNVGKSSLINALTGNKKLAKTSGKPGKTQLINHFNINDKWYLVDLPGYGYATTSKVNRNKFQKMIKDYIQNRKNLMCVFVLIDIRHPIQFNDKEFLKWIGENLIPFGIIFTKTDKLSKNKAEENISVYKKELLKDWESLPETFSCSSKTKIGIKSIIAFINAINE